ncbi:MAG TPA: acetyl-CoA carboxylase carboxyltransferase subunit alpha [Candidatus Goldiibacteriota bacterium]|nr:acetyl-CoA carboxylase carboxyltransferase subunit alpha [Candidatus Goldiibacteriota bacterium]
MEHHYLLEFEKPIFELRKKIEEMKKLASEKNLDIGREIKVLEDKAMAMREETYRNLSTWQIIQIMRHPKRPRMLDLAGLIFEDFMEMHGDRSYGDDRALIGGPARLNGIPVMILGLQKGKDTKENLLRNFGMSQPEGYRKALRLMKFAEKFSLPVLTFIDTDGAFPGLEGEERGVAEAIARNLLEMARLKTPIIINVIGMGGSGGALGIGVGDRVLMLKYATYSVISYEGAASILWKDASRAAEAAKALKPTAADLYELKVIDEIVEEPIEGAHTDYAFTAARLKEAIARNLDALMKTPLDGLLKARYEKFRNMGIFVRDGEK